jgi:hypothetical protein
VHIRHNDTMSLSLQVDAANSTLGVADGERNSPDIVWNDHMLSPYDNNDDNISIFSHDESNVIDTASDDGCGSASNGLSKRDTKRVMYLKLLVILILIASATIISVVVYLYITRSETKQFEAKFQNDADKIVSAISTSMQRTLGALNAIAVTFVSYAYDQGMEWPFVTLPDYALHASKLLPLTDGLYVAVIPSVTPAQKGQWEEYANQNDLWVNQSLAIQEVWDGYHGDFSYDWTRSSNIFGVFGDIEANVR